MPYYEFHAGLPHHIKTRKLMAALKIRKVEAVGHLAILYAHMIENKPGGSIKARDLPIVAEWEGDGAAFVQALADAELVEIEGDLAHIHDWDYYTRHYRKAVADAQRRREERERARGRVDATLDALKAALPEPATTLAPVDGIIQATAFCKTPGYGAKRKAIEDLIRRGFDDATITAHFTDPAKRSLGFYEIVQAIEKSRGGGNGKPLAVAAKEYAAREEERKKALKGGGT